jgi:hypothetical protein
MIAATALGRSAAEKRAGSAPRAAGTIIAAPTPRAIVSREKTARP